MNLRTLVMPDLANEKSSLYPWILCILAVVLFFPGLGSRDFWAPVEPRYAEIARVMFAKDDWLIPTINGGLYTDKPILYFWLVLLASKVMGTVNEWTVRLPAAFSALGAVLTIYFFGRDLFTPRIGFMAAIVFATSARVLWEARWAHTDMPFTFFFILSLYFLTRRIFAGTRPRSFLLAYPMMGLATLTKGLIGVVLPGLILLVFVAVRNQWRELPGWRIPSGILLFLLIAAPWFIIVTLATDGRWLQEFVFVHHIERYLAGAGHRRPFYYYLLNFPADFLPWTVFLVPALFAYRSRVKVLSEPVPLFVFIWFFVIFVFFSLSNTKRALYLLPAFPAAALFVACYFDDLISGRLPQDAIYRGLAHVFFNLLWIGALALPAAVWVWQREALALSIPVALVLAAGAATTVFSLWRGRASIVFVSTAVTVGLCMAYAPVWIFPFIDRYKSPQPFARRVNRIVPPDKPLYVYADTMNDFNFYTGREVIPILSSPGEIEIVLSQSESVYVLIRENDLGKLNLRQEQETVFEAPVGGKKWRLSLIRQKERPKE